MAVYRRSHRQRFVLLIVTLLSVTLVTLDQRGATSGVMGTLRRGAHDVLAPVESAASAVFSPVGDFFGGIANYGEVKAENARLRRQLAEQRGVLHRASNVEREYRNLLDLNGLSFVGNLPTVTARVISASPSNFEATIEIDKGTDQGVAVDLPVVAGEGLVGRVVTAARTRSTVLLITDTDSNVGVKLADSGDIGVVRGRGAGAGLSLDFIDPKTDVKRSESVVTSGLQQSVFPPGIPVGKVRSASSRPGALQQDITIAPYVDLRRLTFVKILQWSPS